MYVLGKMIQRPSIYSMQISRRAVEARVFSSAGHPTSQIAKFESDQRWQMSTNTAQRPEER